MDKSAIKIVFNNSVETNLVDFLKMLKASLSLNIKEKFRVLSVLHKLSQKEVNELINIFEIEAKRYKNLSHDHPNDIQLLKQSAHLTWEQLCLKLPLPQIVITH